MMRLEGVIGGCGWRVRLVGGRDWWVRRVCSRGGFEWGRRHGTPVVCVWAGVAYEGSRIIDADSGDRKLYQSGEH